MDAFTAIFTTFTSSAASTTEAPRNDEKNPGGMTLGCVVA
ncbi:hypothetical protein IAR50_006453 [Cryptococcus sp. DSM 104548]